MAKEDLLPFKYDATTNTVFNTSGNKIASLGQTKPRSKSWIPTVFNLSARLLAWYVIYMVFWACPPNARLDPSTQAVCQRYDTIKHTALPYVKPYYDSYAEPYLARAHPFLQKGQAFYEQFGAPAVANGQDLWVKQAGPRIRNGYTAVLDQYKKNIYPVLDRTILNRSRTAYSSYIDPHVQKILSFYSNSLHPHVTNIHRQGLKLFNDQLVPAYHATVPQIQRALHAVEATYAAHVEPRVHAVIRWIITKIEKVVVPRVTLFWAIHVQPQLDRIHGKLFPNQEDKKVASKPTSNVKTPQTLVSHPPAKAEPTPTIPLEGHEPDDGADDDDDDEDDDEEDKTQPTINPELPLDRPVQVDALLEKWQSEIRKAGIDAEEQFLSEVAEIFKTERPREESITEKMVLELSGDIETELASLESTIIHLVKKGRASETDDPRIKEINKKISASGKKIRNHAVEIRKYLKTIKERFEGKILERRAIAWKTMDVICGNAQTEIGNLWMWLPDITYYDWQEYHALHDLTNTIKQRIHKAGAGEHFDIMAEIQENAEAQINAVAKDASNRITKLKEIARKRILLGDSRENFGADDKPATGNVESKGSEVVEGVESSNGIADQVMEGVGKVIDATPSPVESGMTEITGATRDTLEPQGKLESVQPEASKADLSGIPVLSQVLSSDESHKSATSDASEPSIVKESIVDAKDRVQKPFKIPGPSIGEKMASQASHDSEPAVLEKPTSIAESITEQAVDKASEAVHETEASIAKAVSHTAEKIASQVVFEPESDFVEKAADASPDVGNNASQIILSTEPKAVGDASDAGVSGGMISSKDSEALHESEPGVLERASSVALILESDVSETTVRIGSGGMDEAPSAVESVVDEVEPKTREALESASSIGSNVTPEATEVIGAATSSVWENI